MTEQKTPISWFEIIRSLNRYSLRKHKGFYTLGFTEGRHRYSFHRHDTGQSLNIYVVEGDNELQVYERTEWFSSNYYFNGFGRGWIHRGPWEDAIKNDFIKFEAEVAAHISFLKNQFKAAKQAASERTSSKVAKFAALYE